MKYFNKSSLISCLVLIGAGVAITCVFSGHNKIQKSSLIVSSTFDASSLFQGKTEVSVVEFFNVLKAQVPLWEKAPLVKKDYQVFLQHNHLSDTPELYHDFVRVRLAFEATRAGGFWGAKWSVTNQLPQSDLIWQQWNAIKINDLPKISAIAECDELSALFAVVVRGIGLSRQSDVGLFWPTSNHTVAVWVPNVQSAQPVRVVVPTSQIFLDGEQSLGTTGFDPWKQRSIFDYKRKDVLDTTTLPVSLARSMIVVVQQNANRSQKDLQVQRNINELEQRIGK